MNESTAKLKSEYASAADMPSDGKLVSVSGIIGNSVFNAQHEKLGSIQDLMLDMAGGKVHYAVLASDGFMDMGDHLFSVPWTALKHSKDGKHFMLEFRRYRLVG
ncbi:hypothetical protein BWR19_13730 [Halomonas sp. 1513]|nr:PRC-barrel domain-containing protein [Halomonas sp. 1513]APX93911.1 hypothetical protein BWR19_13730 [Halomonas sp. 1513]